MGNRIAAEKLFWELVEDLNLRTPAIAQNTTHLIKAASHAYKHDWEGAANACLDMAGAALNLLGHGEFSAAKDIIWDMAMAAHIAANKDGAMFPEVQREVMHNLVSNVGNKALAYLRPLAAA